MSNLIKFKTDLTLFDAVGAESAPPLCCSFFLKELMGNIFITFPQGGYPSILLGLFWDNYFPSRGGTPNSAMGKFRQKTGSFRPKNANDSLFWTKMHIKNEAYRSDI